MGLLKRLPGIFSWRWSLILIILLLFSNLVTGQDTSSIISFDAQPNPVYLDGQVKFKIEAEDNQGLEKIFLRDVSTGILVQEACHGVKFCQVEFTQEFSSKGDFQFCAFATNLAGEKSPESCLTIKVFTSSQCNEIKLENSVIATKIKTKKLHLQVDGFEGYPLECCPYCQEIEIDLFTCEKLKGDFDNYQVIYYPVDEGTYQGLTFPENILPGIEKPFILCHSELEGNLNVFGVVDASQYLPLDFIYSEEKLKYWLIDKTKIEETTPSTGFDEPKIDLLKEAAIGFVEISLGRGNKIGLIDFATEANIGLNIVNQQSSLTDNELALKGEIIGYHPEGWTNLTDAIKKGIIVLENNGGAFEMVLMSDGNHAVGGTTDTGEVKAMAKEAANKGYVIHTIALGNEADETILSYISSVTGGTFYKVTCDISLKEIYEKLANELGDTVLISDVSSSMKDIMELICPGQVIYKDKYILAEEEISPEKEIRELVIIDAEPYSDEVNKLMLHECYHKQPESLECTFDCEPPCNAPCGCVPPCACSPCCPLPSDGCCSECHQVYDYTECIYEKYVKLWGRPYVDYLFCYKTPLKETTWCKERVDLSSSVINYPWYSFGIQDKEEKTQRNLDNIPETYLDNIHEWNDMQQVMEMPDRSVTQHVLKLPETDCYHEFDSKLFREVWAKIFTVTPFLNDERNSMTWSRTGKGTLYAGGGFRREPSCWWECCRMCAPFCNCPCAGCGGYCNLYAAFCDMSRPLCPLYPVTKTMKITIRDIDIEAGSLSVIQNSPTQVTVTNGALTVVSTGNIPFRITSTSFSQSAKGVYTLTQVYYPSSARSQFVVVEDITFNYNLKEEAEMLPVMLSESVKTYLDVATCVCGSCCPPSCCPNCFPGGIVKITTGEYVSDHIGTGGGFNMKKIDALKEATKGFVDLVVPGMEVGLVAFQSRVVSSLPLTDDATALHSEIDSYTADGGTCIGCGVETAMQFLSHVPGEKHIIIFSDGIPNSPIGPGFAISHAVSAVGAAASQGITVHTVAIGNDAVLTFMRQLAILGGGEFYEVNCECLWDCVYQDLATKVSNAVVLVNDVSGSMIWRTSLDCLGKGPPVIHENILRDIDLSITGTIDSYEKKEQFITHKGSLNITVFPDVLSEFTLKVKDSELEYSSLKYPVKHELYRKEYGHGVWEPGYPYTPTDPDPEYGYLPAHQSYKMEDAYGYEARIPIATGFEFPYLEQGKKICPTNCFCPPYDLTDVTCVDYSEEPPRYYSLDDCVCPERDQTFLRPLSSLKTFHGEEFYYYDFVDLYTLEIDELEIRERTRQEKPIPPIGGSLSGNVKHITQKVTTNVTTTTPTAAKGKVVFDSSFYRFMSRHPSEQGPGNCDNSEYALNIANWLEGVGEIKILIYTGGGDDSETTELKNLLQDAGYSVDVIERGPTITYDLISKYDQVWFIDTEQFTTISSSEVDAVVDYHNRGGGILLSGESFIANQPVLVSMVNAISQKFGVTMGGLLSPETYPPDGCVQPTFLSHPVTEGLGSLSSSSSDVVLETTNPQVKTIATIIDVYTDKNGLEQPYIMVLESSCCPGNKTTTTTLIEGASSGTYLLDFTAIQFPEPLTQEDFEDAELTVFIHFRNNTETQTYKLFPPRDETTPPHNREFHVDVKLREPSEIVVEEVEPGRYNLNPGTALKVQVRLFNPRTGAGIPYQQIRAEIEGYKISQTILTDSSGRATLSFELGEKSAKINFIFQGNDEFTPSRTSDYFDVVSLKRIWWFLSPEVLLLVIVLVSIAFFFRWFKGGRLNLEEMKREFKGKEK